jgi:hypothetical protein
MKLLVCYKNFEIIVYNNKCLKKSFHMDLKEVPNLNLGWFNKFETTSNTMILIGTVMLAINNHLQPKLRKRILVQKINAKLKYKNLKNC